MAGEDSVDLWGGVLREAREKRVVDRRTSLGTLCTARVVLSHEEVVLDALGLHFLDDLINLVYGIGELDTFDSRGGHKVTSLLGDNTDHSDLETVVLLDRVGR